MVLDEVHCHLPHPAGRRPEQRPEAERLEHRRRARCQGGIRPTPLPQLKEQGAHALLPESLSRSDELHGQEDDGRNVVPLQDRPRFRVGIEPPIVERHEARRLRRGLRAGQARLELLERHDIEVPAHRGHVPGEGLALDDDGAMGPAPVGLIRREHAVVHQHDRSPAENATQLELQEARAMQDGREEPLGCSTFARWGHGIALQGLIVRLLRRG